MISLADLCRELSVTVATGRNWVRLGKLVPSLEIKGVPCFSAEYLSEIKAEIKSGKRAALKSRRNKKHVSGNGIYNSYVSESSVNISTIRAIVNEAEEDGVMLTEDIIRALVAECAVQLVLDKKGCPEKANGLFRYLQGTLPECGEWFLIDDIIRGIDKPGDLTQKYPVLFGHAFTYEPAEDILGLLYISLHNIGERKAAGSYFTPAKVARRLCSRLFGDESSIGVSVLDPCCGTGNFILQLPDHIGFEQVYGNDTDPLSVRIARINYALKYGISDPETIYAHISEKDFLDFDGNRKYDLIIGNPPWGYDFPDLQKEVLRSRYHSARGSSIESYDVFVEQALSNLKKGGVLSFVLPEAILNVNTHAPIREVILKSCDFQYLEYLGNAFDGVQCPCIILQVKYNDRPFSSAGMTVNDGKREYVISGDRQISASCISFTATDEEYGILQKLDEAAGHVTLEGHARFALGIVTGNNKEFISKEKTPDNEMVLRGSDLRKYRFKPSTEYLSFNPEAFQQVAPEDCYRAPEKLFYRFICSHLVFAYDDRQTLSLNSCNILIPELQGMGIKYILAVLNSRTAQFYFRKKYNSVKVLRSHIEHIPIPEATAEEQEGIIAYVDSLLSEGDDRVTEELYETIDRKVAGLYGISGSEYALIKISMDGENLFLL